MNPSKLKKKAVEHESNSDTNLSWRSWNSPQRRGKGTGLVRNTNQEHPNYSNVKIGQNTKKSPGDLRRFVVTLVKYHQLTLV